MLVSQSFAIVNKTNKVLSHGLSKNDCINGFENSEPKTGIYYFAVIDHFSDGRDKLTTDKKQTFVVI